MEDLIEEYTPDFTAAATAAAEAVGAVLEPQPENPQPQPKTKAKSKAKTKSKTEKKDRVSRKVKTQPRTIEEFYLARGIDPIHFKINSSGDLVAPPVKDGDIEKIFTLPTYRSLTTQEIQHKDAKRREKIAKAENTVQEAQTILRDTLTKFRNGEVYASDVVIANQDVSEAEKALQSLAWPAKQISMIGSIDINQIILDAPYETRKVYTDVYQFKHYPFVLQRAYVSKRELEEEVIAEATTDAVVDTAAATETTTQPMTAADRGRLGGILKIRRSRPTG